MKHYSIGTEQAYVEWIKRYIFFHNKRHPAEMAEPEIRSFISDLASKKSVSASTQTVALSAVLFLHREVSKKELPFIHGIERAKKSGGRLSSRSQKCKGRSAKHLPFTIFPFFIWSLEARESKAPSSRRTPKAESGAIQRPQVPHGQQARTLALQSTLQS
jgi:Phage integrase, N-terminal SAM-like domain